MGMIKTAFRRIQYELFPTDHQRVLRRWRADCGYELRFNYDLTSTSLVLDVGGYEGQWASDIFSRYCCQIVIFEPVKAFAERIEKRFLRNSSIRVCHYGLGGRSQTKIITVCADGSSIFRDSGIMEEIQIVDVAEYITGQNIHQIDLLKLNIEGAELEVLERLIDTNLIRTIRNLQVQFHEIAAESSIRMDRIQEQLRCTHYPTYQYMFVWENWVRLDLGY